MIRARDYEDGATYISGLYAPVAEEHDFAALACIEGEVPSDLAGVFARNAPNPKFAPPEPYHWFDGDGMVHAVTFAEGRATYRNRWVRTKGLADDEAAGKALRPGLFSRPDLRHPDGPFKNTANTDLLAWQGRLLALWWLGEGTPYALDPHSLETRGLFTAAGTMTAHAKVDPRSGDLVFIDYGMRPPFLTHGVLSPDGELRRTAVELPGPRPQHDIALTERYTVLIDTSMFADPQALATGRVHMRFFADTPTRLGLFDRRAHELVRWFEVPPCYVYHFANAWEREDGKVVVVASRVRDPLVYDPQPGRSQAAVPRIGHLRLEPQLVRWTLDLESGQASEDVIDEAVAEFPRVDDSRLGAPTRAAYLGSFAAHESLIFAGVRRVDLERGTAIERRFPPGWCGGEVSVLPRGDDDDRALLATFVSPDDGGPGELWLLAAADLEVVARLRIPARVPAGFHTRWLGA
uniref:Uncharacterized protein n=1 Tax=Pseudenhygromyxa salsuginis TaxID=442868 RepID=A0A3S7UVD7_9BACT|nr:hypothetical protein [Pseudenhygromyxa salsuginis]